MASDGSEMVLMGNKPIRFNSPKTQHPNSQTKMKKCIQESGEKTPCGHQGSGAFSYYVETGPNNAQGHKRSQTLLVKG